MNNINNVNDVNNNINEKINVNNIDKNNMRYDK